MSDVGFKAKRCGIGRCFEPGGESKWFGTGMVVAHRTHPNSKLSPVLLSSIDKRIEKMVWLGFGLIRIGWQEVRVACLCDKR